MEYLNAMVKLFSPLWVIREIKHTLIIYKIAIKRHKAFIPPLKLDLPSIHRFKTRAVFRKCLSQQIIFHQIYISPIRAQYFSEQRYQVGFIETNNCVTCIFIYITQPKNMLHLFLFVLHMPHISLYTSFLCSLHLNTKKLLF